MDLEAWNKLKPGDMVKYSYYETTLVGIVLQASGKEEKTKTILIKIMQTNSKNIDIGYQGFYNVSYHNWTFIKKKLIGTRLSLIE